MSIINMISATLLTMYNIAIMSIYNNMDQKHTLGRVATIKSLYDFKRTELYGFPFVL